MAVAESCCLPAQSGLTQLDQLLLTDNPGQNASFRLLCQGMNDFGTVIQRQCYDWHRGVLPAAVVRFTILWLAGGVSHLSGRPQQAKKPIMTTLTKRPRSQIVMSLFLTVLIGMFDMTAKTVFWTPAYRI
jgi:hypothetical protein